MKNVYRRRGLRLIHGETVNTLTRLASNGAMFDALATDPPYASGGLHTGTKHQATSDKYQSTGFARNFHDFEGDARSQLGWMSWCAVWLNLCRGMLRPGAPVLMFCDWRQIGAAIQAMEAGGFIHRGVVVWNKKGGRPQANGFRAQSEFVVVGSHGKRPAKSPDSVYLPGVFEHAPTPTKTRRHQTQKPVSLMKDLLRIVAAGGHVLDPFAGSGSTLVAAGEMKLKATGIEEQKPIADHAAEWLRTLKA